MQPKMSEKLNKACSTEFCSNLLRALQWLRLQYTYARGYFKGDAGN